MKHKKHASEEFKQQCVASCKLRGKRSIAEVARELDVGLSTLSAWVKEFDLAQASGPETTTADAQRILRLEKDNFQLRAEIEFLKKISVYFAQEVPQTFKKP